jgi:hypothetical protein
MLRVDGSSCSLYLQDFCCVCCGRVAGGVCGVFSCLGLVFSFRGLFSGIGACSFSVLVLVSIPSFWSSKLLCAFPTSPSSSVFSRRRLLGPQRVMQLWWVQSRDDLRFFSSAKKEGTVV